MKITPHRKPMVNIYASQYCQCPGRVLLQWLRKDKKCSRSMNVADVAPPVPVGMCNHLYVK